jgi:hypothetical protein
MGRRALRRENFLLGKYAASWATAWPVALTVRRRSEDSVVPDRRWGRSGGEAWGRRTRLTRSLRDERRYKSPSMWGVW